MRVTAQQVFEHWKSTDPAGSNEIESDKTAKANVFKYSNWKLAEINIADIYAPLEDNDNRSFNPDYPSVILCPAQDYAPAFQAGSLYAWLDGRHRIDAALKAGKTSIRAYVPEENKLLVSLTLKGASHDPTSN
jgi:hypothetical protein